MNRFLTMLGCLALAGALLAGCGSSSSSKKSSTAASTPAGSPPASTSAAAPATGGPVDVSMQEIMFKPNHLTVKVGQTVKWTNKDSVAHNVTATKGETFKSSTFGPGGSYSYKVDKAGTIDYVCTIHPNMTATLTVTK